MAQQEAKTSIKEEIDLNHALKLSRILLKCNLVPFLVSAPGIGKSSIGAQLADENNLEFVDERLSGYDQTDLNAV